MTSPRDKIFAAVREAATKGVFSDDSNVQALDGLLDRFGVPRAAQGEDSAKPATGLTERMLLEILEHEAIVLEAYKDSVGVWTWGGGVTDASGHKVGRYKDAPATMQRALEVYEWLLREKYLPTVLAAFKGVNLTEAQLAAALSFHWNTGAIERADWVTLFKAGKSAAARAAFMSWSKPTSIIPRRKAEQRLFFDGIWSGNGIITLYQQVSKPSYAPKWSSAKQVDVSGIIRDLMAKGAAA